MPIDGIESGRAGEFTGGYVRGVYTTQRKDFGLFDVSFLDTNLSFADSVLRPWSIMAAHRSLIARASDTNASTNATNTPNQGNGVKTNIIVYHLAKDGADQPMIVREQYNFYDCVPVDIDGPHYSSEGEQVVLRQIKFLYSYYTVNFSNTQLASDSNYAVVTEDRKSVV